MTKKIKIEDTSYKDGDYVELISGIFKGVKGICIERRGATRVLIVLKGIQQAISVEVNKSELRKITE